MKRISLSQAYKLLERCSASVVDNVVTYPSLAALDGDEANEFLNLSWTDEEGRAFRVTFLEGSNAEVKVIGPDLWLIDDEGDETQVTLLAPMDAELAAAAPQEPAAGSPPAPR